MSAETLGRTLPLWSVLPFVGLLLSIALLPLRAPRFWGRPRSRALVAALWSAPVALALLARAPLELLRTARDYASFIILLAALFVISGGIVLRGDLRATPLVNTTFLLAGALLANVIGTTGASMLLIRPLLQTNRERRRTRHIPVFFIFAVSNIGGCLTPLGDPPLFMGFLKGVPFFWTLRLLPVWALVLGGVLVAFFAVDSAAYGREAAEDLARDRARLVPLRLKGRLNFAWVAGVVGGMFLRFPFREATLVLMALLSLATTRKGYREENRFGFAPIVEVAVLFAGIFVTMVPALLLLGARGAGLGVTRPWQFFWLTGGLSSFLDNTPTYLAFLSLARGLGPGGGVAGVPAGVLAAISAGAVFMGANSYIGNGPNFMVKRIAEDYRIATPSFFGYIAYAAAVLGPLYVVATLLFFR